MRGVISRRDTLRGICGLATVGTAGCMQMLPGSDGDLVVRNEDRDRHSVTIIMDRGRAYSPKLTSMRVQSGGSQQRNDFFQQSDNPYPFFLHVYVDGRYVETTEHRWDEMITVTIEGEMTVSATETDRPVNVTPQVRNETR